MAYPHPDTGSVNGHRSDTKSPRPVRGLDRPVDGGDAPDLIREPAQPGARPDPTPPDDDAPETSERPAEDLNRPVLKTRRPERRDWLADAAGDLDAPLRRSREDRRQAMRLRKRQLTRAAARTALNGHRVAWRGTAWPIRGAARTVDRVARWLWAHELHPSRGANPAVGAAEQSRQAVLWMEERARRARILCAAIALGLVASAVVAGLVAILGHWGALVLAGKVAVPAGAVAGYRYAYRAGRPVKPAKPLTIRRKEHVVPDLTIGMIAQTLGQVAGGQVGRAILAAPYDVIQEGVIRGDAQVFRISMPGAASATSLVPHEQRIASGLGRPTDCAVVELLPHVSAGHLDLWVLDKQALSGAPRVGPLGSVKRTNWWGPISLGRTRTGQPHYERLRGGAHFYAGKPEYGKSTFATIAAAHTSLDPYAKLLIVNLKGSADYDPLEKICFHYDSASPESDPRVIGRTHRLVQWLLEETGRRNDFFRDLVRRGQAKGNAVTEELAKRHIELRPMTVIIDEAHRLFSETDNPRLEEFIEALAKLLKACRSVAITVICVTQLAGTESIPGVLTKAARLRGCLKVSESSSMRQILGDLGPGLFERLGFASFAQGTVILTTDEGDPIKIRGWYLMDHLPKIADRALELRRRLDLIDGHAAGVDLDTSTVEVDPSRLLVDLLPLIPTAEPTGGRADSRVAWLSSLETRLGSTADWSGRQSGWLLGELRGRSVAICRVNRRGDTVAGREDSAGQHAEYAVTQDAVREALDLLHDHD